MQEFWDTLTRWWVDYGFPIKVIIVIVAAIIGRWVLLFLLKRTVNQVVTGVKKSQAVENTVELTQSPLLAARMIQRTRTLGTVGKNLVTWIVVLTAILIILDLSGVRIGTLLASAGFIAAGLAFGAQNIVKDLLNGLFIVFEDQLGVGDVVTIGEITGAVEAVGLRVTQVRAQDGTLWFIRNGEILQLGNRSYGWARILLHIDVKNEHDTEKVTELLETASSKLVRQPQLARNVLEMPEVLGAEAIHSEYTTYLITIKTRPGMNDLVARSMRTGLKSALSEAGFEPGPQMR